MGQRTEGALAPARSRCSPWVYLGTVPVVIATLDEQDVNMVHTHRCIKRKESPKPLDTPLTINRIAAK